MISERIEGITLCNTRDLGGLPAADGRSIRRGRLVRSGALAFSSKKDIELLSNRLDVRHIVDLRTEVEREQKPNPAIPGAADHFLPVLSSAAMGITRGQKSPLEQIFTPNFDAVGYMRQTYTGIVSSPQGQQCYRSFFDLLLGCGDGAVLWHCTVGKDRTGIAAFCVEHALGVPREVIEEDYLATNVYNEQINARDRANILASVPEGLRQSSDQKVDALFEARMEYLQAAEDVMVSLHGSVEGYLEQALGLTADRKERLRAMYLA